MRAAWLNLVLAGTSLLVAAVFLVAWASGNSDVTTFAADGLGAEAALGIVVCGAAVLVARQERLQSRAAVLAALAGLLGLLAGLEHATGGWLSGGLGGVRMAPQSAACLVLMVPAVGLLRARGRRAALVGHAAGWAVVALASVALVAHVYEAAPLLEPLEMRRLTPWAAFCFACLGVATVSLRTDLGLARRLLAPGDGGFLARRLLWLTIAVPVVLGWLRLEGEALGVFGPIMGTALLVLSLIVIQASVVLRLAGQLEESDARRAESRADLERTARLTAALARASTVQEVGTVLSEIGVPAVGAVAGGLMCVAPDGRKLRPVGLRGYAPAVLEKFGSVDVAGDLPAARAVRAREPVFIPSPEAYRRDFPEGFREAQSGRHAWAAVPLVARGRALGAIVVSFDRPQAFDEASREPLVRLASQCAQAVDRALLFDLERDARERAQAAAAAGRVGVWAWDLRQDVVLGDATLAEVFGVPAADAAAGLSASRFVTAIPEEDAEIVFARLQAALTEGAPYEVEHRVRGADGRERWVVARGRVERDAAGEPARFLGAVADITAQKELEAQLRRSERAKDAFLAMLGHELRNPLGPILTSLELMELRGSRHFPRERAIIERQVHHMVRLVDDLLDVSRITEGRVELRRRRLELAEAVAAAVEQTSPLLEEKRHRLTVDVPQAGLLVDGDPQRLVQILSNLLTNAAKYADPEGEVRIRARQADGTITLAVSDDGIGVPRELLPRIFDLFVQGDQSLDRADGGLGLGLAIVKSLVGLHGGTVSAASDGPGTGTTFTVTLPAAPAAPAAVPAPPALRERSAGASLRRILVVDDNRDNAEALADVLTFAGHETRIAYDGPSALASFEDFRPEVVLLDIGLPVMDGYEVARRIRARHEPQPLLLAMTGYGQDRDRREALDAGFDQHLTKPLELETVLGLLEEERGIERASA